MEEKNVKKKVRWTKKLKATFISLVLALSVALGGAVAAIVVTSNGNNKVGGDLADSTAVSSGGTFGRYATGDEYYYTSFVVGTASSTAVTSHGYTTPRTVQKVTRGTWGTDADPYVIRNTTDWNNFANVINNGTAAPSGGAAYATATFVIDTNGAGKLDFNNATITPVGNASRAFSGKLFGNLTRIYKAKFGSFKANNLRGLGESIPSLVSGLFGNTSNAKIYDIALDSTCSPTMSTRWTTDGAPLVGCFSAMSVNPYFVNCQSNVALTATNTEATRCHCAIGGLVGYATGTTTTLIACTYNGNITVKGTSSGTTDNVSGLSAGIGHCAMNNNSTFIESGCYLKANFNATNCGLNCGPIAGIMGPTTVKLISENSVHDINLTATDCNTPDISVFYGYPGGTGFLAGSFISNTCIVGAASNVAVCYNTWLSSTAIVRDSVYCYFDVKTLSGWTQYQGQQKINANSAADVRNAIKTNQYIQQNLYVDNNGNVTASKTEAGVGYTITYKTGWEAEGVTPAANKLNGYSAGTTATIANPVGTYPSGFTYAGWRKGSATSTDRVSSLSGRSGNLDLYARWEINAPEVASAGTKTFTYGTQSSTEMTVTIKQPRLTTSSPLIDIDAYWDKNGTRLNSTDRVPITVTKNGTTWTYKIVVNNPTVADSGTYKLHYTLKPTTSGAAKNIVARAEATTALTLTVNPVTVVAPTFDQTKTYTYNGSMQTVAHTLSADSSLYTMSNLTATNAGTYYPTATLKDTANYVWATAPTDPDTGATLAKNAPFRFKWVINKVIISGGGGGTTDPTDPDNPGGDPSDPNTPVNPVIPGAPGEGQPGSIVVVYDTDASGAYVGRTLNDGVSFTTASGAKYINANNEEIVVPGKFSWKAGTAKIQNGSVGSGATDTWAFSAVAVFTPDDLVNFSVMERSVNLIAKQLFVTVRVVLPSGSTVNERIPVDYGTSVTFVKNDPNSSTYEDAETVSFTHRINNANAMVTLPASGQEQNGYTAGVYTGSAAGGFYGEINSGDAYLTNITQDKLVYVGFTAQYVSYTVFHVKADGDGNYVTEEQIKGVTNAGDYAVMGVEKEVIRNDKKTGDRFSALTKAKEYAGFAYDSGKMTSSGNVTVTVKGDGSTLVFIYYARQTYTVSFTAPGATPATQTQAVKFGAKIKAPDREPTKANATFAGWYKDAEFTEPADFIGGEIMPAGKVTFYAKFTAANYKVTFNYNYSEGTAEQYQIVSGNIVGELNWAYNALFPYENEGDLFYGKILDLGTDVTVTYNIDNLTANKSLLQVTPKAEGYTFLGWYNGNTRVSSLAKPNANTGDLITLTARWAAANYTVSFNTLGGSAVQSQRFENLAKYEISAYEDEAHTPVIDWTKGLTLIKSDGSKTVIAAPERAGYVFKGWAPSLAAAQNASDTIYSISSGVDQYDFNEDGSLRAAVSTFNVKEFVDWYEGNGVSYNLGSITFYAIWESRDNYITVDSGIDSKYNVIENLKFYRTTDGGRETITPNVTAVKIGDEITVEYTHPNNYYTLNSVSVNGRALSRGVYSFTVGEYASDRIEVSATFNATQFTITYDVNGGRSNETNVTRTFTAENVESVYLPKNVTRAGYTFTGWMYTSTNEEAYVKSGDDYKLKGDVIRNLSLIARWDANPANVRLYSASYNASEYTKNAAGYYEYSNYNGTSGDAVTDATIQILNPSRNSLIFIGWTTRLNGAVVYPVVEGSNYIEYVVAPESATNNRLFAVWVLENVDYLNVKAENNGTTYGGSPVNIKVSPSFDYETVEDVTITLNYTWYKLPASTEGIFTMQAVPGVWVDKDGNFVDEGTAGAEQYYAKVLTEGYATVLRNAGVWSKTVTKQVGRDEILSVENDFNLVSESGDYICVLEASAAGEGVIDSAHTRAFGEFEVVIEKADYTNVVFANASKEYNQSAQTLGISLAESGKGTLNGTTLTLPDGSTLTVSYKYYLANGTEVAANEVVNAGTYTVKASFEWVDNKGNYNDFEEIDAVLTITPKTLNNVNFHMWEIKADGSESEVTSNPFNVTYNGSRFEVRASIDDTKGVTSDKFVGTGEGQDDIKVVFETYKVASNGATMLDGENVKTVNAGSYYVLMTGLDGEKAANYQLGLSLTRQRNYTIAKDVRNLSGVSFADKKVEFNNEQQLIAVAGTLPEGVTVEYEKQYIPEDPEFTADKYVADKAELMNAGNGGLYAGIYEITAKFVDANAANYEAIPDMYATLTIKQGDYIDFYTVDGENELERGGFVGGSYGYSTVKHDLPKVSSGKLTNTADFALTYDYYWSESRDAYERGIKAFVATGSIADLEALDTDDAPLIRDSGYYTIIVNIEFKNALYANNFAEIPEEKRTIHIDISQGEVEGIKVFFKDNQGGEPNSNVRGTRYVGDQFDYSTIERLEVYYKDNAKPATITNSEIIKTIAVDYGSKENNAGNPVPQTAFWKVGTNLPITFTFYEKEVTYNFTVKQKVDSVTLVYNTDGGSNYADVPDGGLDLANASSYRFAVSYVAVDANGDKVVRTTPVTVKSGRLVRGWNELVIGSEEFYEFDDVDFGEDAEGNPFEKLEVLCYKVITEVTWQYSTDGSTWSNLGEDEHLPYVAKEYLIRVRFEDEDNGNRAVFFEAHTNSGQAVKDYKADNYHLEVGYVEEDNDGNGVYFYINVYRDLTIDKVVLDFSWTGEELEYNAKQQTATATASNIPEAETENIEFSYSFTNENGGAATPAQVVGVGTYTAWIYINENLYTNYTLTGSTTASKTFKIVKANIENVVKNVTYQEHDYPANTSYRNNPQGLRSSALKAEFVDGVNIQGEFVFVQSYNAADGTYEPYDDESEIDLSNTGTKLYNFVFIPADTVNYNVMFSSVSITVQAQQTLNTLSVQLGIGAIRFYLVEQRFNSIGIDVYRIYNSYYQEDGVTYGLREQLPNEDVTFTIGGGAADGYIITSSDLANAFVTVSVRSRQGRTGEIRIPVTDKQPDRIEIGSGSVLKDVWYVGEKFDFSGMNFTAWYVDGSAPTEGLMQGTITSSHDNYTFTSNDIGEVVVTFEFFGATVTRKVEVRAQETLQLYTDVTKKVTLAYRDGAELEAPALKFLVDGNTVTASQLDGVDYVTTVSGADVKLGAEGDYVVQYTFTITNPRFLHLASVRLNVTVSKIAYTYTTVLPDSSELEKAYTGAAIELPELRVENVYDLVKEESVSSSRVSLGFTVNGEPYESGMLVNVGTYHVEVTVTVNGQLVNTEEYTFKIVKAENSVSLKMGNVKVGETLAPEVSATFGKSTVTYWYNTNNGSAGWTQRVPTEVGVYWVRAYVKGTDNYEDGWSDALRFEIRQGALATEPDENGNTLVEVDGGDKGLAPNVQLKVDVVKEEEIPEIKVKNQNVTQGYDVSLVNGSGDAVQPDGSITVRLLISEMLRDRNDLKVYYIDENGKATDMEAVRDGDYMVFNTDHLSRYVITYKVNTVPVGLLVSVIILAVVAAGLVAADVVIGIMKRGKE